MPDDLSEEDRRMSSKIHVVKEKTIAMKKGLTKMKNNISARKKEYVSQHLQPPDELISFLQADETFEKVLEAADNNIQDILVRR